MIINLNGTKVKKVVMVPNDVSIADLLAQLEHDQTTSTTASKINLYFKGRQLRRDQRINMSHCLDGASIRPFDILSLHDTSRLLVGGSDIPNNDRSLSDGDAQLEDLDLLAVKDFDLTDQ